MNPIEVVISELAINKESTNEKIAGQLTKSMDVIFLCHEMKERDTSFNEEDTKKMIAYINNITNKKNILLYLVGCKLDQKFESLGNDTTNIYEKIPPYKLTTYGQRIKTFVDGNKIKKFFATSALLNFNINELFEHAIISAAYMKYKIFHEQKKIRMKMKIKVSMILKKIISLMKLRINLINYSKKKNSYKDAIFSKYFLI